MRETITIPAAGVTKVFSQFSGRSVIIEEMPVYTEASQVPILDFQPGIVQYPLYPRSDYPNSAEFSALRITGTTESAGDEITILTTGQCLDLAININYASSYDSVAGTTQSETLSDSVFTFDPLAIEQNGKLPKSVLVSSTDNSIHLAFNVDPTQGAGGLGHRITNGATSGEYWIEIEGLDFILNARFINRTNQSPAEMIYTFRY